MMMTDDDDRRTDRQGKVGTDELDPLIQKMLKQLGIACENGC